MKEINVGKDKAKVDDGDYAMLKKHTWYKNNKGYAYTFIPKQAGGRKGVLMHRLIMQPGVRMEVHHINHDPLDNQRQNLMICTHQENLQSLPKPQHQNGKKASSQYKGVYKHKNGKYKATIRCNGIQYYLKYHKTEIEAAKAYDEKAKELFGAFAVLNFP